MKRAAAPAQHAAAAAAAMDFSVASQVELTAYRQRSAAAQRQQPIVGRCRLLTLL